MTAKNPYHGLGWVALIVLVLVTPLVSALIVEWLFR